MYTYMYIHTHTYTYCYNNLLYSEYTYAFKLELAINNTYQLIHACSYIATHCQAIRIAMYTHYGMITYTYNINFIALNMQNNVILCNSPSRYA